MTKANKRSCFVAATLCLATACAAGAAGTAFLPASAAEDGKQIESVQYNEYEAIVLGDMADITATVSYTDGTSEQVPIKYTQFPVDEMVTPFHSFYAEGYIDGWDGVIEQNIIVMPDNVEYMIDFGSNYTDEDYVHSSGEVLGKVLDHTGANSDRGYYAAIKREFPEIRNKVGSKQYGNGQFTEGEDWGYVQDYEIVYYTGDPADSNPYEFVMFPTWGELDTQIKFWLPEGEYDVYLGFYSHWFPRNIGISMTKEDGTTQTINDSYTVNPREQTIDLLGEELSGETTFTLVGPAMYEEPLISFLCVTQTDTTSAQEPPSAPAVPELLQLSDTQMLVSGLTSDSKLQLYNYDNSTLLYEYMVGAEETEHTIDLTQINLDGIVRLGVCCTTADGMGATSVVNRTDIARFDVSYSQAYVSGALRLNLSATAFSDIVSLDVYKGEELLEHRVTTPSLEWADVIYLHENGDYRLKLTSAQGGVSIQELSIGNIDRTDPVLSVVFNMETAQASSADAIVLSVTAQSVAPIAQSGYVRDGVDYAIDFSGGTVALGKSGSYTLYYVNELGKSDALRVNVAMSASEAVTTQIGQSTMQQFTQYSFVGRNGYTVSTVTVYGIIDGEAERLLVNGSENDYRFNMYDDGVYFAEVVTSDGAREFILLNSAAPVQSGTGTNVGLIVGFSVGGAVIVIGGGLAAFLLIRKKKASK